MEGMRLENSRPTASGVRVWDWKDESSRIDARETGKRGSITRESSLGLWLLLFGMIWKGDLIVTTVFDMMYLKVCFTALFGCEEWI